MKVYFLDYTRLMKKAILVGAIVIVAMLVYRFTQYNLLSPATTKFEPIYQGDQGKKQIALTCNVMWGEEFLPEMLQILDSHKVKVTFYLGGLWARKFPDLTKEIYKAGHEIGNHGYSHPHPTYISRRQNIEEITKTEKIILDITGQKTKLFAPPYGEYNDMVLEAAGSSGYKTILWSIDTIDWQRPAPDTIVSRVTDKAFNGAIVLMHPTAPTLKALPAILQSLSKEGYKFVTVSDLIDS